MGRRRPRAPAAQGLGPLHGATAQTGGCAQSEADEPPCNRSLGVQRDRNRPGPRAAAWELPSRQNQSPQSPGTGAAQCRTGSVCPLFPGVQGQAADAGEETQSPEKPWRWVTQGGLPAGPSTDDGWGSQRELYFLPAHSGRVLAKAHVPDTPDSQLREEPRGSHPRRRGRACTQQTPLPDPKASPQAPPRPQQRPGGLSPSQQPRQEHQPQPSLSGSSLQPGWGDEGTGGGCVCTAVPHLTQPAAENLAQSSRRLGA